MSQLQFLDLDDLDQNELEVVHNIIYSVRSNNLILPWPDQTDSQPVSWNQPSQPQTPQTTSYDERNCYILPDGQGGECGDGGGGGAGGDVYPVQPPVATTIPQLYHSPVVPPQIPNMAAYMPNMHGFTMQQYHNPPIYPSEPTAPLDQRGNRRPRPSKPSPKRTERRDHPSATNSPYPSGPQPPHMSHPYVPPQPTPPAYLHPVPIPNPYSYISPPGHMPSAQHATGHHIYLPPLMYPHQTLYGQFPHSVYAPNIQQPPEEIKHSTIEANPYDNKQEVTYEKKEFEEPVPETNIKKPEETNYDQPAFETKEPEISETVPIVEDEIEEHPPSPVNQNEFPIENDETPTEESPPSPPPEIEEKNIPAPTSITPEPMPPAPVSPVNSVESQPDHSGDKPMGKSLPLNAIRTTALPPNLCGKRRPQLGEEKESFPSLPPAPLEGKSWAALFKMGGNEPKPVSLKIPTSSVPANKPLPPRNHIRPPINAVALSAPPCFDPTPDGTTQTKPKSKHGDHSQVANFHSGKQGVNHQNPEEVVDPGLKQIGKFLSNYSLEHKASCLLVPRGLSNPSNYCYINATLQALLACPPFYNLIKDIAQVKDKVQCSPSAKAKTPIIDSMVQFIKEFKPGAFNRYVRREKAQARKEEQLDIPTDSPFEPTYVYKMLHNNLKKENGFHVEGRQEDAEEFLSLLLNGLNDEMLELLKLAEEPKNPPISNGDLAANGDADHDDWKEVTKQGSRITRRTELERTPLSDIFRGELRCRIHRTHDESTDNVQPFFTLQLDIESAETVSKALEKLVGMDPVEGVSSSDINAWQQQSLNQLPCVLILHLKCFHYRSQTCSKIVKALEFPIDLKLEQKLLSKTIENTKSRHYKLFAVVYHDGKEASKGHYLSDVYHVGTGNWIRYDDATVQVVGDSTVLHPKPPRVPYLLYYRRLDTIGMQQPR